LLKAKSNTRGPDVTDDMTKPLKSAQTHKTRRPPGEVPGGLWNRNEGRLRCAQVARTNTRVTADVLGILARCHKAILPVLPRFVKALHGAFDYNRCE
jgi:hypothetical protein